MATAPVEGVSTTMRPASSVTKTRPVPSGTGARKAGWLRPATTRRTPKAVSEASVTATDNDCVTLTRPSLTARSTW